MEGCLAGGQGGWRAEGLDGCRVAGLGDSGSKDWKVALQAWKKKGGWKVARLQGWGLQGWRAATLQGWRAATV